MVASGVGTWALRAGTAAGPAAERLAARRRRGSALESLDIIRPLLAARPNGVHRPAPRISHRCDTGRSATGLSGPASGRADRRWYCDLCLPHRCRGVLVWRAWRGLRTQPPAGPRHEFEITPSVGAEFHIERSQFPELLRSAQRLCEIVPGWGDHRIRVAGVEIAFFVEDTAIQVSFEGEIPEAEARDSCRGIPGQHRGKHRRADHAFTAVGRRLRRRCS